MIQLDERLGAIATLALETAERFEYARVADIGCDHGYLSAYLLERSPRLRVIASDVSAPSLEKARQLLLSKGFGKRVHLVCADGLDALEEPVHAIVIAGMGAETILKIVSEGRAKIGEADLIVQANVDLPKLRAGLCALGFPIVREVYTQAAGRQYVTMLARMGERRELDEREALLGKAAYGARDEAQKGYFRWQRDVRVREMEKLARLHSPNAQERMMQSSRETAWIQEALGMNTCTVSDMERLVDGIAPYELAEEWDNVGLLLGRRGAQVERVLVALDLTQSAVDEAKALGAQLIVTHHPIMFRARKRMTDEDREGALMLDLASAGIAHIAAHTNLDAAPGGVNDTLMAVLGCENVAGEGCVRVGDIKEGTTLGSLTALVARRLKAAVRAYGNPETPVRKLGCCSGGGGEYYSEASRLGADCFLSGEVHHHEALDALAMGVCMIEAGHYETENPVCEVLADALQKAADALEYKVTFFCSKGNPFER